MNVFEFIRSNLRFLLAGTLLMFTSSYGQTFFFSTFAAEIMSEFSLTDGEWGLAYTAATTASAVTMFWAGALADRFAVRTLSWVVLPGLALGCFAMAINPWVAGLVGCVFLLRLLGQGMTYQLAAVAMARWFVARRGLALSISSLGFAIATSALPVLCAVLLEFMSWRAIWAVAGIVTIITFPVLLYLLAEERTPQSFADESESTGMLGRHWTRLDMLKSSLFLMLIPLLLGPPAWGTALFFQQVHIAEVKGFSLVAYLSLIPILTVVAVCFTLLSGALIDRFGTRRLMQILLVPYALGFIVLSVADTLFVAGIAFAIFGIGMGLQSTVITAFWAEYYGTRHIGAIKATSTSIMVFGSAIGPGVTGLLIDAGFDFPDQMLAISVYFGFAIIMAWIAIDRAWSSLSVPAEINVERA